MTPRELPSLEAPGAYFWTSGAEGILRIGWCTACGLHLHPSVEVCPGCFGARSLVRNGTHHPAGREHGFVPETRVATGPRGVDDAVRDRIRAIELGAREIGGEN